MDNNSLSLIIQTLIFLGIIMLIVRILYDRLYMKRANNIANLVMQEKFEEAIKLGESVSLSKLNVMGKFNLLAAYHGAKRYEDAKKLLKQIKPNLFTPSVVKTGLKTWEEKLSKH
ncbi:MAG: hypothetical protein HYT83_02065 [Candidatus Levybacteria bacterium]|nr:hypothetical protein [Candidatus Levybacteria bacterium]